MLEKVFDMTQDKHITGIIGALLTNRRFYVQMGPRKSKWRNAKNCLPQGGVLASLHINIYINDQPLIPDTRSFIYADDRAVLTYAMERKQTKMKSSYQKHWTLR